MKNKKLSKVGILGLLIVGYLSISILQVNAQSYETVLKPLESFSIDLEEQNLKSKEIYINRKGLVNFSVNVFLPVDVEGKLLSHATSYINKGFVLSFFPDQSMTIIVDKESRPQPNVLSLLGHIPGETISTFSLTVTEQGYRIVFQDLQKRIVYRTMGNIKTGKGKVIEIDLDKMPPIKDLPAIVPPKK